MRLTLQIGIINTMTNQWWFGAALWIRDKHRIEKRHTNVTNNVSIVRTQLSPAEPVRRSGYRPLTKQYEKDSRVYRPDNDSPTHSFVHSSDKKGADSCTCQRQESAPFVPLYIREFKLPFLDAMYQYTVRSGINGHSSIHYFSIIWGT